MEKWFLDSISVPAKPIGLPVISVRRVVYFVGVSGDEGWTLTPQLMGAGEVTKYAWLIEVDHPQMKDRIVVESYPTAFIDANAIIKKLGAKGQIPIIAEDWSIDADGNLTCLDTACVRLA